MSLDTVDKFGRKLPIPYIEKIQVYDNYLKVGVSVYIDIPESVNSGTSTEKATFLTNIMDGLDAYCSLLHDRNSDTKHMGLYDVTADRYYDYPIKAYSDVINEKLSPLETMFGKDVTPSDTSTGYLMSSFYRSLDENNLNVQCAMDRSYHNDGYGDNIQPVDEDDSSTTWTFVGSTDEPDEFNVTARWNVHHNMYYFISREARGYFDYDFHGNVAAGSGDVEKVVALSDIEDSEPFDYKPPVRYHCGRNTFSFGSITDFTEAEVFQRQDGTARYKYTKSITIGYNPDSGTTLDYDYFYEPLWQERGTAAHGGGTKLNNIPKVGIVAFSTALDLETLTSLNDIRDKVLSTGEPIGEFNKSKVSGCSFKTFLKEGQVYQEPSFMFTDQLGQTYVEAMQTINGRYYAANELKSSDIVSTIRGLVAAARTGGTVSSGFENTLNSVDSILSAYGDSPSLLIELNKFRKIMPDKSGVTPAGVFHERFKTLLFNANNAYKQKGIPVTKTLVNNPVVQDLRAYSFGSPSVSDLGDFDPVLDYIYPHTTAVLWSRYTEVVDWDSDMEGFEASHGDVEMVGFEYHYNLIDHGFWFFNYEKAIKTYSSLSTVLDVHKYEKYFGTSTTNGNFLMQRASVSARLYNPSDEDHIEGIIHDGFWDGEEISPSRSVGRVDLYLKNSNGPENNFMVYRYLDSYKDRGDYFAKSVNANTANLSAAGISDYLDSSFGGARAADQTEYSFLALRGFSFFANTLDYNPMFTQKTFLTEEDQYYRLACFEYQKCDKFTPYTEFSDAGSSYSGEAVYLAWANNYQYFRFMLDVYDSTHKIAWSLINNWKNLSSELDAYVNAAGDLCSYNETDGFFNKFFLDAVYSKYPVQSDAPHIRAAVLFHIMDDIINDSSDGDQSIVYTKTKATILNIGPEAGTLEALEAFKDNWDELTTTIEAMESDLVSEDTEYVHREFGGDECNYIPREDYQYEPDFPIVAVTEEDVDDDEDMDIDMDVGDDPFGFGGGEETACDDCPGMPESGYTVDLLSGKCAPPCGAGMIFCRDPMDGSMCGGSTSACMDADECAALYGLEAIDGGIVDDLSEL